MKKYFQAPWSLQDLILIFSISAALVAGALIGYEYSTLNELINDSPHKAYFIALTFVVQWLLVLGPVLILTIKKYRLKAKTFGLKKTNLLKSIKLIISSYLLFLVITILFILLILFTGIKVPGYNIQENLITLFGTDLKALIIAGIVMVGIAPFVEEFFFRGFLLRSLVNKTGIVWGSLLTALIFSLFHFQLQSFIPIFILGLIINRIVLKSKSLWPAIGFHIFNNAIAFTIEVLIIKEVLIFESIL